MEVHKPHLRSGRCLGENLAEDLKAAGYEVMNAVRSGALLDEALYEHMRAAFAEDFQDRPRRALHLTAPPGSRGRPAAERDCERRRHPR
jgi:hypothetical protein